MLHDMLLGRDSRDSSFRAKRQPARPGLPRLVPERAPGRRRPARYELFDHIWLSPTPAEKQTGAFIDRRTRHSGDGSDHDPASITLDL
jgi:hypothetical protein